MLLNVTEKSMEFADIRLKKERLLSPKKSMASFADVTNASLSKVTRRKDIKKTLERYKIIESFDSFMKEYKLGKPIVLNSDNQTEMED